MTPSEDIAKQIFERKGFTVLRNGWPDFLCYKDNGFGEVRVLCVEVKTKGDGLRPEQERMHEVLKRMGFPVSVMYEEDVKEFKKYGKAVALQESKEELLRKVANLESDVRNTMSNLEQLKRDLDASVVLIQKDSQ